MLSHVTVAYMEPSTSPLDRFNTFYSTHYLQRWPALRAALLAPSTPVALAEGLEKTYYLDEGSIIATKMLPIQAEDTVLDMCAAPGGKSLILATALNGSGSLVCNDRSSQRRQRLRRVIEEHLSKELQAPITFTSHDATRWGLYEQSLYDAILLDAPCSSERHVLQDPKFLAQWSPSRTKRLAIQQFAMLAAALEAVKPQGYVLYSTCSISPLENEEVIAKLEKKRKGRYEEIKLESPYAEARSYGNIILPDTGQGRGPLYFCLLRRTV